MIRQKRNQTISRNVGVALGVVALVFVPLASGQASPNEPAAKTAKPAVAEAQAFVDQAEKRLLELWTKADRAEWVQQNFITYDTERMAAEARKDVIAGTTELALAARRFDGIRLPYDVERKLKLLRLSLDLPAPNNPKEQTELAEIVVSMQSDYGKGRYCPPGEPGKCYSLNDLERLMAASRDPKQLLEAWKGWHAVGASMRGRYQRFVTLANRGAQELGFADLGAMWRSNYEMPPDDFSKEVDRLWSQVKPLYDALHAHVRASLARHYGNDVVPPEGPIPAHLLGNMWSQTWDNIYPLAAPPESDPGFNLTELLRAKKLEPLGMARYAEGFFTSLGFEPLPKTFWERSLFTKPADRDVVCHASAWDIDQKDDLRIKMCIEINAEDFATIHHELGHNFYQRAYSHLPPLYRNSANDGFHEGLGDTIALSITPEYLRQVGLLEKPPAPGGDLGLLMRMALVKVAFLPFGLVVDQWRWKVFSGEIPPGEYNKSWWELRKKYQGIAPPLPRSEADFDPGAKYHVSANVPYTRYFLATILQFQFFRALCREAGYTGPLHRCSIYNNRAAGAKLKKMLEMGQSRPWPEALEALTGEKQLDATALLDYFAPLQQWLEEQNKGRKVGF